MRRITAILLAICLGCTIFSAGVQAKAKTTYYLGHRIAESRYDGRLPNISKITKKGKKLAIRGEFYKSSSYAAFRKGKMSIVANKTFSVTEKCKYNYTDSQKTRKVSQKKFLQEANREYYKAATIEFKTNKYGSIYYMNLDVGSYRY